MCCSWQIIFDSRYWGRIYPRVVINWTQVNCEAKFLRLHPQPDYDHTTQHRGFTSHRWHHNTNSLWSQGSAKQVYRKQHKKDSIPDYELLLIGFLTFCLSVFFYFLFFCYSVFSGGCAGGKTWFFLFCWSCFFKSLSSSSRLFQCTELGDNEAVLTIWTGPLCCPWKTSPHPSHSFLQEYWCGHMWNTQDQRSR